MLKAFLISILFFICFALFETSILSNILVLPAIPDFLLIISVYLSIQNGRLFGVSSGFVSGLVMDFCSFSPFGLNCLLRTLIGYTAGIFNKTININGIILPALLGLLATVIKAALIAVISFFFPYVVHKYNLFSSYFIFELVLNCILTPLVFRFLDIFKRVLLLNPEQVN